jgi:peptide/nickel transport system ATP-binding protein
VRSIAQRVAVLADGSIVEYGETAKILANPNQEYTRHLISDTPSLETATGDVPPAAAPTDGAPQA